MAQEPSIVQKPDKEAAVPGGQGVSVGEDWVDESRVRRRTFPGPAGVDVALRVVLDPPVMADLHAHARETLEQEVGGVLAGDLCQDDRGPFVHVRALVRALHAKEGRTDLTFTQETWDSIHRTMEDKYSKYQILGWYHTHPGYGVEFSEMDLFIQRNFFPAPTQLALVTDPLSGEIAACVHTEQGIRYIDRIWLDGREQKCKLPRRQQAAEAASAAAQAPSGWGERLDSMERRLTQVLQALDEQRDGLYRFQVILAMILCLGVLFGFGYHVWSTYRYRSEPPKALSYALQPVRIGDDTVYLGIALVGWKVPPELNAVHLELEKARLEQGLGPDPGPLPPPGPPTFIPIAPPPAIPGPQATPAPERTPMLEATPTAGASPQQPSPNGESEGSGDVRQ